MIIIGCDLGLAHTGLAAVRAFGAQLTGVLTVAAIETKKSPKEDGIRAGVDNVARAKELRSGIEDFLTAMGADLRWDIRAFAVESMCFPRNSTAAQKMGIAWGILSAIAWDMDVSIFQASPQAIKRALGVELVKGNRKKSIAAEKRKVILEVGRRYPGMKWPSRTSLHEHIADAVGAAITCAPQIFGTVKDDSPQGSPIWNRNASA